MDSVDPDSNLDSSKRVNGALLTCVVDELSCSLHAGVGVVIVAEMEGPYTRTEHLRMLLWRGVRQREGEEAEWK